MCNTRQLTMVRLKRINLIISRRLSGLAEGVSSIIQCAVRQEWSSIAGCSSLAQFEPRYIVLLSVLVISLPAFVPLL